MLYDVIYELCTVCRLCLCAHVCEGEQVRISLLLNEIRSKRWRCPKCASLWM